MNAQADQCIQWLHASIKAIRGLIAAKAADDEAAAHECQRAYTENVRSLRTALNELQNKAEADQASQHKPQGATSSDLHGSGLANLHLVSAGAAEQIEALSARVEQLRAQVSSQAELEKGLIDQLRGMLDAMSLWESYKRQLETSTAAAK